MQEQEEREMFGAGAFGGGDETRTGRKAGSWCEKSVVVVGGAGQLDGHTRYLGRYLLQ
jgi:hypothetical protein